MLVAWLSLGKVAGVSGLYPSTWLGCPPRAYARVCRAYGIGKGLVVKYTSVHNGGEIKTEGQPTAKKKIKKGGHASSHCLLS